MTVRERITDLQRQLRDQDVTPLLAREALIELTALYGNVQQEQREADLAYKLVLLKAFEVEGTANRARLVAEVSPEYQRARAAGDLAKMVVELIRSCKVYLRSLEEEMRLSK